MLVHKCLQALSKVTSRNKLSTLIYHQVFDEPDPMRPSEPTVDVFRWHMSLVRKYFNPISLTEAVSLLAKGKLPANAICITFDDGYLNNLNVAQPVLEEFNIPATVYIATRYSSGENMWNDRVIDLFSLEDKTEFDLSAIEADTVSVNNWETRRQAAYMVIGKIKYRAHQERTELINQLYAANNISEFPRKMMTDTEIKTLRERGIDIGAHTVDHPILTTLNGDEQRQQMLGSRLHLEKVLGEEITGFAYPNGKITQDYDAVSVSQAEQCDFNYAVSTNWGISTPKTPRLELNRFTPWDSTPTKFHLRLVRNILGV